MIKIENTEGVITNTWVPNEWKYRNSVLSKNVVQFEAQVWLKRTYLFQIPQLTIGSFTQEITTIDNLHIENEYAYKAPATAMSIRPESETPRDNTATMNAFSL